MARSSMAAAGVASARLTTVVLVEDLVDELPVLVLVVAVLAVEVLLLDGLAVLVEAVLVLAVLILLLTEAVEVGAAANLATAAPLEVVDDGIGDPGGKTTPQRVFVSVAVTVGTLRIVVLLALSVVKAVTVDFGGAVITEVEVGVAG